MSPSDEESTDLCQAWGSPAGLQGPRVAANKICSIAKKDCIEEEEVQDEEDDSEEVKEEVEEEMIEDKQQPCDSDVTFGSIPKSASRSHPFMVNHEKLALVTNRKIKWK